MFVEPIDRVTQVPGSVGKVFISAPRQVLESLLRGRHVVVQMLVDLPQELTGSVFHFVEHLLIVLQIDGQTLLHLFLLAVGVCQTLGLRGCPAWPPAR